MDLCQIQGNTKYSGEEPKGKSTLKNVKKYDREYDLVVSAMKKADSPKVETGLFH